MVGRSAGSITAIDADSERASRFVPSPNFGERQGRSIDSIVLHYTGMATGEVALTRLCDPTSEVSCHYLVWEDGRVDQLVAERHRAWHAGRSFWAGERDLNAVSIGIEIVNAGHDAGHPPYPEAQIEAVIALCRDVGRRHAIAPSRVLAHSDVAPDRKIDPGEWFPWDRLAASGVGLHVRVDDLADEPGLSRGDIGPLVVDLQVQLAAFGFDAAQTGSYDDATSLIVAAFQRHYRGNLVDGIADLPTRRTLAILLDHNRKPV